jgi:hypothetical protein
MKKIFLRSPYTISINEVGQIGSRVELFIWNANMTEPTIPSYTMSKKNVSPTQTENVFNISNKAIEFIKEINPVYTSDVQLESLKNWCYAKVKRYKETTIDVFELIDEETFICFDGYNSFLGGANQFDNSDYVALFNQDIKKYVKDFNSIYVNVFFEVGDYDTDNGTIVETFSVLEPGLYKIPITSNSVSISKDGIGQIYLIKSEQLCEPKYTPIICSFINRFGGWEFLTFFKANQKSIEVKSSTFNLMPESWNYNTYVGSNKQFNFNGMQKITCNTGWVDENYFELIQDLLLSPVILLDDVPVICKSTSTEKKTQLKEKNINYTINFEYNFNIINDVI